MIKPFIIAVKPTITALVFLLVSSYFQGVLDKAKGDDPCAAPATNAISKAVSFGILGATSNQVIMAGSRALRITRHAAERMAQRGVTREIIHLALDKGKLFAYLHSYVGKAGSKGIPLVKIGYYNPISRVFVAVDKTHEKIITVIRGVPAEYVTRLLDKF